VGAHYRLKSAGIRRDLFDLDTDPAEKSNVLDKQPSLAETLQARVPRLAAIPAPQPHRRGLQGLKLREIAATGRAAQQRYGARYERPYLIRDGHIGFRRRPVDAATPERSWAKV
jgi:hypothetical protein